MHRCGRVWANVSEFWQVWAGLDGCGWVCMDMHGCVHVCGMNFQNFFQRIESLHQRTLIPILYEFFIYYTSIRALYRAFIQVKLKNIRGLAGSIFHFKCFLHITACKAKRENRKFVP